MRRRVRLWTTRDDSERPSPRAPHVDASRVVASRDAVAHARWRAPPTREVRDGAFLPRGFRALDAADDDRATRGGAMCTRNAVWHNARGRDATARARATRIGFD